MAHKVNFTATTSLPTLIIQVIPTANKFRVLANLNDVNEALSVSIEGDITSRNFKKENQKKTQGLNSSGARRQRIILTL
jgi:plasmid rolling circle replication initiator protein Rep